MKKILAIFVTALALSACDDTNDNKNAANTNQQETTTVTTTTEGGSTTTSEKIAAEANDVKRDVKQGYNRMKEELCDENCMAKKAKNRAEEAKDLSKDKAKEAKDAAD